MPEVIPGINTQQKVVTVANNDEAINTEIETQGEDGWLAGLLTPNGSNIIILFSRNVTIEA